MTPTERRDVIETLLLIRKHKKFAKKLGLVDKTKFSLNERGKKQ